MSDEQLRREVAEELAWDPRLDISAVTVSAESGVVTLRGAVASFAEKSAAIRDVLRVQGVVRVADELRVALFDEYRRDDADLRNSVLQALQLNSLVPSTIDATVDDGWVTLTGTASSQFQRTEAEQGTARVRGVRGITDDIALVPFGRSPGDLATAITRAMRRSAKLDASTISVDSSEGTVTLRGTVSSWADHDEAIATSWAAPGVVTVIDELHITHAPEPSRTGAGDGQGGRD